MCNSTVISNIKIFNRYYMPFIIIVGLTGNIISVIVFMSPKLKRIPSSHCLTAMALVDCGVLLLNSFNLLGGISLLKFEGLCQTIQYISNILYFLSVWFVVSFTAERFVVVYFPLHRLRWCTVKRCRVIIVGTVIASCLWNVYVVAITRPVKMEGTNETSCTSPGEYWDVMLILNCIDTGVTFVLPFFLIVLLNSLISIRLIKSTKLSSEPIISPLNIELRSLSRSNIVSHNSQRHVKKNMRKKEEKITKVLLLVSFVFLIMNLPDHVLRLTALAWYQNGVWSTLSLSTACTFLQAQQIANIIFNTNFSINFFLYNLAGRNFRRHVKELLKSLIPCLTTKTQLSESLSRTSYMRQRENFADTSSSVYVSSGL